VYYQGTPPRLCSELKEEVSFSYFDFPESTGMLALHLHTMAKLGVIVGQPLLKLVCENTRYIALDG
jgi:hypothetical protein